MPAPNDRNALIALAKGWTWQEEDFFLAPDFGCVPELRTHWLVPIRDGERYAEPGTPPDFVGTLEGVSGMLWDLGSEWQWGAHKMGFACFRGLNAGPDEFFMSPHTRPGHCVGDAYLAMKEAADESGPCQHLV